MKITLTSIQKVPRSTYGPQLAPRERWRFIVESHAAWVHSACIAVMDFTQRSSISFHPVGDLVRSMFSRQRLITHEEEPAEQNVERTSRGSPPALSGPSLIYTMRTVVESVSPRGGRLGGSRGEMVAQRRFLKKRITKQPVVSRAASSLMEKPGSRASKALSPRCALRHVTPMRCSREKKGFFGQMCLARASPASWKAPYIAYKSWLRKFLEPQLS